MARGPAHLHDLSVVVVMLEGHAALRQCLRALAVQPGAPDMEVLVPWDAAAGDRSALQREFPSVQFLTLDGSLTYAELRTQGITRARGRIIALTEDHCTPAPGWCAAIARAHADGHAVVGGVVEKETPDDAVGWAVYLADYLRYMAPVAEGPTHELTDCNVSYTRAALGAVESTWAREFHEPAVHAALRARGHDLWLSPGIVVHERRRLDLSAALRDRYAFGRLFAATRVAGVSIPRRVALTVGSSLLPALLVWRVLSQVARKRRHLGASLLALPALVLLSCAWGLGESAGYFTAQPGATLTPGLRTGAAGPRNARRAP